jgi:poly[(R)-3-hydroxyalkanoate] polymerase subunit PhaC
MPAQTPDPTPWFFNLLAAQQHALRQFGAAAARSDAPPGTASTVMPWLRAAEAVAAWQQEALKHATAWWSGAAGGASVSPAGAGIRDRRVAATTWRQDPHLNGLMRAYREHSDSLRKTLEAAPLDERSKAEWGFVLRQVIDALSPVNCLATNPEALQMALASGGASLVQGMRLFLQDFASGRITTTDLSAFEVGRNLATTPGSVVFENELIQLIEYAPSTVDVHERPLLIVPPCVNKFYVLDLQPDNSFVAHTVAQGHTVFLVSWRNVGPQQGRLSWDDYLEMGVLQAIDVARAISGADRINTLGFCIGGTLLACALAVIAARRQDKVASVTLLNALLDFSDTGDLGLMVNQATLASREATIGRGGLFKGSELALVFAALRANDLIWHHVVSRYLKGKEPEAFDLLFWNSDSTNLPGPMLCWYLRNGVLENKLRVPGGTVQCGERVELGAIDLPAFVVASREDHIVPWQTAYASTQLLGGDITFVLGASGHIAGVINPPARSKRNFWVGHWVGELKAEASDWLEHASSRTSSWWPAWTQWLQVRAGGTVPARGQLGNGDFPVIEAAPGRYVKAMAD